MLENLLLSSTPPSPRITLHTASGRSVENEIAPDPEERHVAAYNSLRDLFGSEWIQRRVPYGRCNCFGMVFATRRTAIYADKEIEKLLADDGYRLLQQGFSPMPGDIVLYRSPDQAIGLVHAGLIVGVSHADNTTLFPRIQVLSKWNDSAGEDIHLIQDAPFFKQLPNSAVKPEIWTDRRKDLPHAKKPPTIVSS